MVLGINQVKWTKNPIRCNSIASSGPAKGIRGHKRRVSGWNKLPKEVINCKINFPFLPLNKNKTKDLIYKFLNRET
ncbi:hypothetical protein BpHYR1_025672 [Brachionus plicatilis]|uniref:RNA-directed DNA polymerase from mobile element jockey-like n=1 Tax=Brachionus plicatilis TaxID=10195 RepID=A0A3M7SGB3_BRAPC|nr:hypothetical protein BpHYR1_025672 [Brachionus plicatilis]